MGLLDRRDLIIWNNLRLALCERSETFCASLWYGEMTKEKYDNALSLLSKVERDEWERLSRISLQRSRAGVAPQECTKEDFNRGIREIFPTLSNVDLEKLKLALHLQERSTPEDAAFAMKTILRNSHLTPELRERFIRFLALHPQEIERE